MAFLDEFEPRSSLRTWLYRIANERVSHRAATPQPTRAAVGTRSRADDPHTAPIPTGPEVAWLSPIPDDAAAVNSALQWARAPMKEVAPAPDEITEPTEPRLGAARAVHRQEGFMK